MQKKNRRSVFFLIIVLIFTSISSSIIHLSAEIEATNFLGLDEEGNITEYEDQGPGQVEEIEPDFSDFISSQPAAYGRSLQESYFVIDYSTRKVINEFQSFEQALNFSEKESNQDTNLGIFHEGKTRSIRYGVVNFNTKTPRKNITYKTDNNGDNGYINGLYVADAAFLGTRSNGAEVKFKVAGVIGWVAKDKVQIVDYNNVKSVSFYRPENGRLYHHITRDISKNEYSSKHDVGPAPNYLIDRKEYYSYDGHYFYESYALMIDDYKKGNYNNSVNSNKPYYNYYQFLSHRSLSNVTASELDTATRGVNFKDYSVMRNSGKYFKDNEKKYGANALLMFGVAINESDYGTSKFALERNNIFGHNAVDAEPSLASKYQDINKSIEAHANIFISKWYLNKNDWRYFGAHLGDKGSGMNVKYASDPYWGEKAAAQINVLEKNGVIKHDRSANLAIRNCGPKCSVGLNVRKHPNTSSTILYTTPKVEHIPFIVISEAKGTEVNGSNKWYKVLSDSALNNNRDGIASNDFRYNGEKMYGYIHSSYVDLVNFDNQIPQEQPQEKPVKKGDVDDSGDIEPSDYAMVRDHIMGKIKLTGRDFEAADVDNSQDIEPSDYALIRDHLLGKINLKDGW